MPRVRLERVTSLLRERIRDAAEMGALKSGDRLPGTRRLAGELGVDPRLIASAFRRLAEESLIELRPRSGAYLATQITAAPANRVLPREWSREVIAQAVERGIPAQQLASALERLTDTNKVRVAVVAGTSDQAVGMVRELQDDYGITAAAVFPEQLSRGQHPKALLRAQLILTTADLAGGVRPIAAALRKDLIVVRVRPDLFSPDWIAFMNGPVFVIVADPRFRVLLRQVIRPIPGSANVTIVPAGSAEVALIPGNARTYVTEAARRMLGRAGLPGRIIRPRRVLSGETVREIVGFLVEHNATRRAR